MNDKPTAGFHDGAYLWHTDNNGVTHWGSPAERAANLAEERSRPARIAEEDRRRSEAPEPAAQPAPTQDQDARRQALMDAAERVINQTPALSKDRGFER